MRAKRIQSEWVLTDTMKMKYFLSNELNILILKHAHKNKY